MPKLSDDIYLTILSFLKISFSTTDLTDSSDIFSAPSVPLCKTTVLFSDHRFNGFIGYLLCSLRSSV